MGARITDEHLNAYVDGELAPQDAARVTLAITSDRTISQRVVRLQQLKAAVAGFAEAEALPDLPAHRHRPDRRPVWWIAAGLAGIAAMLATLDLSVSSLDKASREAAIQTANIAPAFMTLHDQWVAQPQDTAGFDLPDEFSWMAPVILSSNLQLLHLARSEGTLHLGFKGPNACRISIFVSDFEGVDDGLRMDISDRIQRATWQIGPLGFEMIARDMAPARFATVAAGLHQNSRTFAADPQMQLALSQAAQLPCTA